MLKTVDRMPTSVWPGLFRNWFQKHTSLYSPYIRFEDEGPKPIPALKPFIKARTSESESESVRCDLLACTTGTAGERQCLGGGGGGGSGAAG